MARSHSHSDEPQLDYASPSPTPSSSSPRTVHSVFPIPTAAGHPQRDAQYAVHLGGSASRQRLPVAAATASEPVAVPEFEDADSSEEDKYSKPGKGRRRRANGSHPRPGSSGCCGWLSSLSLAQWVLGIMTLCLLLVLPSSVLFFYSASTLAPVGLPLQADRAPHGSPAAIPAQVAAHPARALVPPSPPPDAAWNRQQRCDDPINSHSPLCSELSVASPQPSDAVTAAPLPASALSPQDVTFFTVFSPDESPSASSAPPSSRHHRSWLRAMYSWSLQVTNPQRILVLVRVAEHCMPLRDLPIEVRCRVISCWDVQHDSPYLRCVMDEAMRRAETEAVVYVEDHIVLFADFLPALVRVASRIDRFFLVGSSSSLSLSVDSQLDLKTWHKDVEAAIFLDSSDAEGEKEHARHQLVNHSHSLHYFAFSRRHLDLSGLSSALLMGGGAFYGHQWEKLLVSYLLLQDALSLVDVTQAVTAVEMTHADSSNRTEELNAFNEQAANASSLSSSQPLDIQLGRIENAHFVVVGKCPTCSLKENREADLPLILIRHANAAHQVIVIVVNSVYLSLAFNWICRARFLGLRNFVMLAEDRVAYRVLRKLDVAVVLRRDAPYEKQAAVTGSAEFQETLYLRALFFRDVVGLGFHLVLSHLDTVWFEDPLPLFARSECDMFVQMEGGRRADGGLLSVKASALGLQFVKDYLVCEQENWDFITVHGKSRFFYSDDPDMNCVDLISQRLVRRSRLKRCQLDPNRFVSEETFFDRQSSQLRAIYPAYVHLNSAQGLRNKTRVFLDWDLWAVDDGAMAAMAQQPSRSSHGAILCRPPPKQIRAPLFEAREHLRIVVNVLASVEHFALQQTLEQLAAAEYDPLIPVDLRITVQQPQQDSASDARQYVKAVAVAREFVWPHGTVTLLFLDSFVGPSDGWLDHWWLGGDGPEGEQVFQLAIQAGQSLSTAWFSWTRSALHAYYYDPFQYDPQLMGIHLQHQFSILGESPSWRSGSRIPSTVLAGLNGSSSSLFHYQLLPLFGTLFFPQHLLSFLHWYSAQNHSSAAAAAPSRIPCVPTLISNSWYLSDPIAYWWQWLVRFTFESGWYGLYTNFISMQDKKPRALAVDQTPLAGQLTVQLMKKIGYREGVFPPRADIALFDLHFNLFDRDRRMLAVRKTLFPPMAASRRAGHELQAEWEERQREEQRERAQWAKERGGGGSEAEEEGEPMGLWAKIRMRREEAQLAEVGEQQVVEHSSAGTEAAAAAEESEDVITPTDLIVELMKTAMTDSDEATAAAGADGALVDPDNAESRQQLERIATRLRHIAAGELHRHSHVRGSQHDRCFVVGDEPVEEVQDVAVADAVSALPFPYNASFTIPELYQHIYTAAFSRLPAKPGFPSDPAARFIVYRPRAVVPLDRHLRGLYFAFLVALVSQRIFLVDLPDFESMFDCPLPGVRWSFAQFRQFFPAGSAAAEIEPNKLTASLRTRLLSELYPDRLLLHVDAVSYDRLLFTNAAYRPYAMALFDTHSRMKRTGMIMRWLQSRPRNALIQAGKDLQRELGLGAVKYSLCVHVVAPPHLMRRATETEPLPGVSEKHWECVQSQLIHLGFTRSDSRIFFTSNSPQPSSLQLGQQQLDKYGAVVTNPQAFNANLTSWGMGNATVRASVGRDALSGGLVYDPYILHHFILGDCDVSISSGTTYGIFGAARTGFSKRAYVYRSASPPVKGKDGKLTASDEPDYCGPMHRIDLPNENDINF